MLPRRERDQAVPLLKMFSKNAKYLLNVSKKMFN
jgi:hypothetical protein